MCALFLGLRHHTKPGYPMPPSPFPDRRTACGFCFHGGSLSSKMFVADPPTNNFSLNALNRLIRAEIEAFSVNTPRDVVKNSRFRPQYRVHCDGGLTENSFFFVL